jgi:hypothetical protein
MARAPDYFAYACHPQLTFYASQANCHSLTNKRSRPPPKNSLHMFLLTRIKELFAAGFSRSAPEPFADPACLGKATRHDERFREVVADPVNLLINRVPEAGYVDGAGKVILHNGNRVPLRGPGSYYGDFSDLLVVNRGVHEPLEEYSFQQMLACQTSSKPVMLELGSYWAHYSMWLKKAYPEAICHLIEADAANLEAGRENFRFNGFVGEFHQAMVGHGGMQVDAFLRARGLDRIDILHSDIQGFEAEMLDGAANSLAEHRIDRLFVSTHSEALHASVESVLRGHGYLVEISSACDRHTTSYDGFILASAPSQRLLMDGWSPLGRLEIAHSTPARLLASIAPRLSSAR